jgi:Fe-S-cluster containining protein
MDEAVARSGAWIACRPGCTQCCIGDFEITVLDARRLKAGLARLDSETAQRVRLRAEQHTPSDESPCPALDPISGLCDLYDSRPITCRTFGPATRIEGGNVGACDLCYQGATTEQIAACAVDLDPEALEAQLLADLSAAPTTVAQALAAVPASC